MTKAGDGTLKQADGKKMENGSERGLSSVNWVVVNSSNFVDCGWR